MYSIYSFFPTAVVQHIEIVKKKRKNKNIQIFGSPWNKILFYIFLFGELFPPRTVDLQNESRYHRPT